MFAGDSVQAANTLAASVREASHRVVTVHDGEAVI